MKKEKKPAKEILIKMFAGKKPRYYKKRKYTRAKRAVLQRRKLALAIPGMVKLLEVEPGRGRRPKMATLGVMSSGLITPSIQIGKAIRDALDPVKVPSKVRTLADMSKEEKLELEKLYGVPVKEKSKNPFLSKWFIGAVLLAAYLARRKKTLDGLGEVKETNFVAPIKGSPPITSLFGERRIRKHLNLNYVHRGLDLAAKIGTPVYAIYEGNIALAHEVTGFGNCVVLKHEINGERMRSVYAHLTDIKVRPGQEVSTGQLIGTVGITGRILGKGGERSSHLHIELLPGWTSPLAPPSERIDPLAFLQERGVTPGKIA